VLWPWVPCTQDDRNTTGVPHDQVVWASPDYLPITFKQLMIDHMLTTAGSMACRPKSGYSSKNRTRIFGKRMKRRKPVEGDEAPKRGQVEQERAKKGEER
jgi:hypothetical protein